MLPIILRRWSWCYSYFVWLCGFYYEAFHVESYLAPCSHAFFRPVYYCDHLAWGRQSWSTCFTYMWAASWQNQQNDLCAQRRQISLGIHPVWSESSLSAWRKLGSLATYWAHSEDSDQTGWMSTLIWVFAGCKGHFVSFVVQCYFLSFFSSTWCHGLAASYDCGTLWIFHLTFCNIDRLFMKTKDQNWYFYDMKVWKQGIFVG